MAAAVGALVDCRASCAAVNFSSSVLSSTTAGVGALAIAVGSFFSVVFFSLLMVSLVSLLSLFPFPLVALGPLLILGAASSCFFLGPSLSQEPEPDPPFLAGSALAVFLSPLAAPPSLFFSALSALSAFFASFASFFAAINTFSSLGLASPKMDDAAAGEPTASTGIDLGVMAIVEAVEVATEIEMVCAGTATTTSLIVKR